MSLIDDYLQRLEENSKIREPGVYFATDLTKPCLLNAYMNIKEEVPPNKKMLRRFETGNILEDFYVQNVLRNTPGITVLATQLPARVKIDDFQIHGRIDCLTLEPDGLKIHEVKTAKTSSWMTREKDDHYLQINFYLCTSKVCNGTIDYIDKKIMLLGEDDRNPELPPDTHYSISKNEIDFYWMIDRGKMLHKAVTTDTPPAPEPCWMCQKQEIFCDYHDKCPAHRTQTTDISTTPVINTAAETQ